MHYPAKNNPLIGSPCVGVNVASKFNADDPRRNYKTGGVIGIHQNLGIER